MLRRGQSDTGSGYQYKAEQGALLCWNKRGDPTPFVVARQLSQSQLSFTGVCFEVSDKRHRAENIRMSSAPFNANEQQRNSDDSGRNEVVHRTESCATLTVTLNTSLSMRSILYISSLFV